MRVEASRYCCSARCIWATGRSAEERFVDRLAHLVQLYLERVDELVQTLIDDLADLHVVELRTQPAQPLFGQSCGNALAGRR